MERKRVYIIFVGLSRLFYLYLFICNILSENKVEKKNYLIEIRNLIININLLFIIIELKQFKFKYISYRYIFIYNVIYSISYIYIYI